MAGDPHLRVTCVQSEIRTWIRIDPWETDELEPGALSLWAFWQLSLPTPTPGELES